VKRAITHAILRATLALGCLAGLLTACPAPLSAKDLKVTSDQTVTGFKFAESAACDAQAGVLYVSEFGSKLEPTLKDGKGRISKVGLDGKVIERGFLPAPGQTLHKPKGVWAADGKLWVSDIDAVWVFDTKTKAGRKVDLPGIEFANDVAVAGDALYISDSRGDQLYRVRPADFLGAGNAPEVSRALAGKSIFPNGLYPDADGGLLLAGFKSADEPRGLYRLAPGGAPEEIAEGLGRLDGLYRFEDGDLMLTDWNSGSLGLWNAKTGLRPLAEGFSGPADFCVVADGGGLLVAVPDLPKGELRLIRLGE